MEFLTAAIFGAGGFLGAVLIHLVASDLHEWMSHLTRRLIMSAAGRVPEPDRDRYREEWLAHLDECVGVFSKLRHALEVLVSARVLKSIYRSRPVRFEIGGHTAALSIPAGVWITSFLADHYSDKLEQLDIEQGEALLTLLDDAVAYIKPLKQQLLETGTMSVDRASQESLKLALLQAHRAGFKGDLRDMRLRWPTTLAGTAHSEPTRQANPKEPSDG
jgi:hypothetical protein